MWNKIQTNKNEEVFSGVSSMSNQEINTKNTSNISFYLLLVLVFLLPLFFIPYFQTVFAFGKMLVLSVLTLFMAIATAVSILKVGRIRVPKEPLLIATVFLPVVYLVSSLFSDSIRMSLFGYGFEAGTFFAITVLSLLLIIIPFVLKSKDRMFSVYLFFLSSFGIISIFQLARLFLGVNFLNFNVFVSTISNVVGNWSDLAVFFGLGIVLSLISIELLDLNRIFKFTLYSLTAVSLFFLMVINFSAIWILLGIFSFILFAYLFSFGTSSSSSKKVSKLALSVVILSIFFVLAGDFVTTYSSRFFDTASLDARPSLTSTLSIAKEGFKQNPITSVGPNRFSNIWIQEKPADINNTIFWNTNFNSGYSFFSTIPVTTGVLGTLFWLIFILLFLLAGFRSLKALPPDGFYRYLNVSSLLASFYLWTILFVYNPNIVILALAFLFTGLFIASSNQSGVTGVIDINLSSNPKKSFATVLLLIFISTASFIGIYFEAKAFSSHVFFQKGINKLNIEGNLTEAEENITLAIRLFNTDVYMRGVSELELLKLSVLLNDSSKTPEETGPELQSILDNSIAGANLAIEFNPNNYENWVALGNVYESLIPIEIEGAYEQGLAVYNKAKELNPNNPLMELYLARINAVNGNFTLAKEHIGKALTMKNNYVEAIFLLSQMEVSEGKIDDAIKSAEAAAVVAPNDFSVFFQLGLLKYNNKDYRGSASAFERAVLLNPNYSNAMYFLGLNYYELDKLEDAISQFEQISILNPDNAEIKLILSNLKAGRAPFTDAKPPIDDSPESRDELPIEE